MSKFGNCQVLDTPSTFAQDTSAYSSGDVVGGLVNLGALRAISATAVLKSLVVLDSANQKAALTILLFSGLPAGTFTDNGALVLSAADLALVVAKVNVLASDYETVASRAIAQLDLSLVLKGLDGTRNLYMVIVTTGTPTYTALCLKIRFGILND